MYSIVLRMLEHQLFPASPPTHSPAFWAVWHLRLPFGSRHGCTRERFALSGCPGWQSKKCLLLWQPLVWFWFGDNKTLCYFHQATAMSNVVETVVLRNQACVMQPCYSPDNFSGSSFPSGNVMTMQSLMLCALRIQGQGACLL